MEAQLTNRLLTLSLKDEPEVTRNRLGDCLFLCFVQAVKTQTSAPRNLLVEGDTATLSWPTHASRPVAERERVDVSNALGMRQLAADSARAMLSEETPNAQAPLLKRHIMHRFRSAYMRERDHEVLGDDGITDDATDAEKIEAWCKLMSLTGVTPMLFRLSVYYHAKLRVCALPQVGGTQQQL
jgi:hypothetical protein